jgi:NAD(P)H-dependent flavin oxidoreductase YrpB (nitropropane dioxygenase family)
MSFDPTASFCSLTGVRLPVIQAPIGSAAIPILAAAVSEAGALGTLALSWSAPDVVRATIGDMRARTAKPFAVNLLLEWPQEDRLGATLDEGVKLISLAWGDPRAYVKAIHDAGALLIQTVSTAEEARRCVEAGADIIVAQGWEAGGHVRGTVATLALTPAVVDAVAPVPVVAAGGIADGRGLAAVLALGASGAWIGTRFLASVEARAHDVYKQQLLNSSEADTILTGLFEGGWPNAPHRVLRNSTVKRWLEAGSPQPGSRPGETEATAFRANGSAIAPYNSSMAVPDMTGDVGSLPQYSGQGVALIHEILPAAEIVAELMHGAREAARHSAVIADTPVGT